MCRCQRTSVSVLDAALWLSRLSFAVCPAMAVSPALQARRALVKVLLALATVYAVVLDLNRVAGRPTLGKTAYKARVRAVCRSKKAQQVAASQAKLMKRVCNLVIKKRGAATGL